MAAFVELLGIRGLIGLGVAVVLSIMLGLQVHKTHKEHASAVQWETKYTQEHGAFLQTIVNYGTALQQAKDRAAQNIARVEQRDAAIGRKTQASYEERIAAARALAERLRRENTGTSAHSGGTHSAPVPGVSAAPGRPSGPAAQDELSRDDQLTATEQAIQLDELIKWVESVHAVNVNHK